MAASFTHKRAVLIVTCTLILLGVAVFLLTNDLQREPTPVINDGNSLLNKEIMYGKDAIAAARAEERFFTEQEAKLELYPECSSTRRLEHPGMENGPRVQYIHNPKAGGTSVEAALYDWIRQNPRASIFRHNGNTIGGSSTRCPAHALDASVLTGHRGFGYCKNIEASPRGLFAFTALRAAVPRMVSWYDYNLFVLGETRAVAVFGKQGLTLSEIVKRYNATSEREYGEQLLRYAGQQQARFLCGYECMGPMAHGNRNYTDEYILKRALDNLNKLDAVGLTERLDDLLIQLRFHLPELVPASTTSFPRDNRNRKKSTLDTEAMHILSDWGRVDDQLYRAAVELFEKKHALASRCLHLFGE